ncbi:MAG: SpoIIE family protein phosphatase [Planctomycetota bacterium]|nr:SpoIIE family protein phosphatase [Planctomycetota bacterium]
MSKRQAKPAGTESAAKVRPPSPGKTGRMKRPAGGKKTQKSKPVRKEELQELEPITPFARGVGIGVKLAAFTAVVVGLFMGLQGFLTFTITAREMDEQIMDQGVQIVSTLEKTVDRGFWVQPSDPEAQKPRELLISDWEERLRELVESNGKIVSVNIMEGNQAIALYPRATPSYFPGTKRTVGDISIFEGSLADSRVRRFDKPIRLGLEREEEIDKKIDELEALEARGADAQKQLEVVSRLRTLTGARALKGTEEFRAWREEHPRPTVVSSAAPSVSIYVQASRLDELKSALWKRIAIVTASGAVAGILLTVVIATLLTAPVRQLEQDVKAVASGDLGHQTPVASRDEIGALTHVFNIMIRNLQIAQNNAAERKSFERELNICKEIQEKLLPERIPQIPGFDIHSHYRSAKEVGGDYYDFIVIDQTHLGIIVADVAGKGVPGAMVMTMARSLVRLASVRNVSPADTFKKVNRILAKDIRRGMFVTAAYMVLNVKTRKLRVASAGHNPVVLYRAASSEIELLKPAGIALGFDKGTIFDNHVKEVEVQLETGDRIVTYTDGVNEAMNNESEEFGDDRFHDLVKAHARKSSKDFVDALVGALDDHRGDAEQSDDITITTLAVVEAPQGGAAPMQDEGDGGDAQA